MTGEPDVAVPARALGETARARMAVALLGGRTLTAGELTRVAGLAASTASEHLQVLTGAGIVSVERRGRHRHYRLAGGDVAHAVEALQAIAPMTAVDSLRGHRVSRELVAARTCYDHLAGDLGLRLTDLLVAQGVVDRLAVGAVGRPPDPFPRTAAVETLDLGPGGGRRPWVRGCLDWTGRRPHVAGQVGAQVLDALSGRGWIERRPDSRAVRLTDAGVEGLAGLETRPGRA